MVLIGLLSRKALLLNNDKSSTLQQDVYAMNKHNYL